MTSRLWGVVVARMLIIVQAALLDATGSAQAEESPAKPESSPRQIVVRLSGDLLLPLIEKPIDEVLPVEEVILGVRAIGDAHVLGQPQLVLTDDPDAAAFAVTLTGTIQSRTVGRKGPVQIHSRSLTQFTASKRVTFQPGRGFVGEPATIAAQTNSQTERIEPDRGGLIGRAIEWRAWTRVGQSREQVNAIIRSKAEAKIREAFDRLLEGRLARVNRMADQRYALAAVLGGTGTPRYACSTKHGCLFIAASARSPASTSQPRVELPARGSKGPPVQIWVHEGVVGERAAMFLRQVDLFRRMLIAATRTVQPADAEMPQDRARPSYDFATCGEWIVVEAGQWPPANQGSSADLQGLTAENLATTRPAP